MTPQRWGRLEELFHAAVELDAGERAQFLERECGDDVELRASLLDMLREDDTGPRLERTVREAAGLALGIPPNTRIGAYEVLRELGRGGMGIVYLARRADDAFQKQVAIKLVRRGIDNRAARERFRRERQILARLEHPYIARLLDGGATGEGLPFFVMEYVDGEPICAYAESRALRIEDRIELFRKVCETVQYAHQNLVVHRDLKPTNILVAATGEPKLLDFGIARILAEDESEQPALTAPQGARFLTPEYASPEQIRGEPVGTGADIYSLGAVLYELLAGTPAFRLGGASAARQEQSICIDDPPRPSTRDASRRRRLSGDLDNIVLKAMRKAPAERYGSAAELSEDLARHLRAVPVLARDYTLAERGGRFIRRHRLGVAAAALAVAGLLGGTGVATWQAIEARRQRFTAEQQRMRAERSARAADESARRAGEAQSRAEQEGRRAEAGKAEAEAQRQAAQRQQSQSERRAVRMQQLASRLLNDIDQAIRNLPGSVEIRTSIVTSVRNNLEQLMRETGATPEVEWELGLAWQRLGDVQGNYGNPNQGDLRAALASFNKAAEIWTHALTQSPGDTQLRSGLAVNEAHIATILLRMGQAGEALTRGRRGVEIAARVAAENPKDPDLVMREARAWAQLAGLMNNSPEAPRAVEAARKARELYESVLTEAPGDFESRDLLATTITTEGRGLMHDGRSTEARRLFERVLAMREVLTREEPANLMQKRRLMLLHGYLGDLMNTAGRDSPVDPKSALLHYREAARLADSSLEADPSNTVSSYDAALGHGRVGTMLMKEQDYPEALRTFERSTAILERLHTAHPLDASYRANYASQLRQIAECQSALKRNAAARETLRKALGVAAPLATPERPEGANAAVSTEISMQLAESLAADRESEALVHAAAAQKLIHVIALRAPDNLILRARLLLIGKRVDAVYARFDAGAQPAWRDASSDYRRACESWVQALAAGRGADARTARAEMERLFPPLAAMLKQPAQ
jgi:tetratricopeptide (TPR) repeat protein/tRNA A-37 threonylcarbamoyl transferase component Bud32